MDLNKLLALAGIMFIFTTVNFILALLLKRNDIADISWGLGFIVICGFFYWTTELTQATKVLFILIALWGARLAIYLFFRNIQKGEDFRYANWRKEWGKHFIWRSFLQVFLLQTAIMMVISAPIIIASFYGSQNSLGSIQGIAVGLFAIGWCYETVADIQLYQFKRKKKQGILTTGLWKYSRHPNYFGELIVWWSIWLFVLPVTYGWLGIISPLLLTFLLFRVSGVPMLEEKYKENSDYQLYVKNTASIIPFVY